MSTRACYLFSDDPQTKVDPTHLEGHIVYKHHDGYPSGAIEALAKALPLAWQLPRFEADEFAASFVAGNKDCGGGVRLVGCDPWIEVVSSDIEYLYVVRPLRDVMAVTAYRVNSGLGSTDWSAEFLFEHPLATISSAVFEES